MSQSKLVPTYEENWRGGGTFTQLEENVNPNSNFALSFYVKALKIASLDK